MNKYLRFLWIIWNSKLALQNIKSSNLTIDNVKI